jgi:hypothetical protein
MHNIYVYRPRVSCMRHMDGASLGPLQHGSQHLSLSLPISRPSRAHEGSKRLAIWEPGNMRVRQNTCASWSEVRSEREVSAPFAFGSIGQQCVVPCLLAEHLKGGVKHAQYTNGVDLYPEAPLCVDSRGMRNRMDTHQTPEMDPCHAGFGVRHNTSTRSQQNSRS